MSVNSEELLKIIRESENPVQSVCDVIDIILSFLQQPEPSQSQDAACLQKVG